MDSVPFRYSSYYSQFDLPYFHMLSSRLGTEEVFHIIILP